MVSGNGRSALAALAATAALALGAGHAHAQCAKGGQTGMMGPASPMTTGMNRMQGNRMFTGMGRPMNPMMTGMQQSPAGNNFTPMMMQQQSNAMCCPMGPQAGMTNTQQGFGQPSTRPGRKGMRPPDTTFTGMQQTNPYFTGMSPVQLTPTNYGFGTQPYTPYFGLQQQYNPMNAFQQMYGGYVSPLQQPQVDTALLTGIAGR